jgi:hypothetical protein
MGFASGFRAGWDAVGEGISDREKRQLKEKLAQESERYGVTEGAYGPELSQNIEQLRGLQAQDPGQAAIYEQSIGELTRRRGLTAPDFSVGSRAQNFATREEAEMAARPMRTQGLAGVYRQAGEIEKADELLERADQQELRGIQRKAAELSLKGAQRTEKQAEAFGVATQRIAEAQANGENITSDYLRSVASETGANFDALIDSAAKQLGFDDKQGTARIKKLQVSLAEASGKGVTGLNEFLSSNFDPDKTDNITPKIVRDGKGNYVVQYGDRVLSEYGVHKSLDYLVGTVQGRINGDPLGTLKTLADIELTKAQTQKAQADAIAPRGIQAKIADFKVIYGREPTEDEKAILVGLQGRPGAGKLEDPTKPSTAAQARYDAIKSSDRWQQALLSGNAALQRTLLVNAGIPTNELFKFGVGEPPGQTGTGDTWTPAPAAARTEQPTSAAPAARAAPTPGLTRAQVGQAVTQQQTGVQAETRVRRAAITAFEQDPRVRQAYDAVRQLRRSGEAVRANDIENQINAQRERFIQQRVGGE